MRRVFCLLFVCLAMPLWAEVSVISVTDEDKHRTKQDFQHTFEYFISAGEGTTKCQATRIDSRWFATAAHCVKDICAKQCTIQMDLLETSVSVLAQGTHTAKNPIVFIHPGYAQKGVVKEDFALIKLNLRRAPKTYYRRSTVANKPHVGIPAQEFLTWMRHHPVAQRAYNQVLRPQLPPIINFDIARNVQIDRKLSVISIFDGKRTVKQATDPVYYLKDLGHAFTTNFGIRKGMSGSGVMTNTGELIGIISAFVGADQWQGKKKIAHHDWFIFPVFNASVIEFMRDTMGSDFTKLDIKDAYPVYVSKTRKDFSAITQALKRAEPHMSSSEFDK